jgi:hypothetical protein
MLLKQEQVGAARSCHNRIDALGARAILFNLNTPQRSDRI